MDLSSPIVVIDSGLGGLTVLRTLRTLLPNEHFIYFADTARLPYGSKSAAMVTQFMRQILTYLRPIAPKHVVIACNTATATALPTIRTEFTDLSISGVIEPATRAAIAAAGKKKHPVISIIATEATVQSKAYERAIHRRRHHARLLLMPTPLLVPLIEEGRSDEDPLVMLAVEQYLRPLIERNVDVLILGCTHYPMIKDLIQRVLGPDVRVIDSSDWCAEDVTRRLHARGMLRGDEADVGSLQCFVTDDPDRFARLASRFLGMEAPTPQWVSMDDMYARPPEVVSLKASA